MAEKHLKLKLIRYKPGSVPWMGDHWKLNVTAEHFTFF